MKSLLNKSLTEYVICTIIVLLLSAPLFYLLTKAYYAEDLADLLNMAQHRVQPKIDLEEDIVTGLMLQYALVSFVLSVSLLVTIRFATRRLWNPFNDTLKKVEQFNLEQSEIPTFKTTKILEFARLNDALSELIKRDKKSYNAQKEFTENASHELQTPIAVMQSKLDLLLQEDLNKKQSSIVSELYLICNRITRINKNLLLLAKIENNQYKETEKIDLISAIKERLPIYKELGDNTSIHLVESDAHPIITANQSLLESLLNNLIINAIRHTCPNSGVYIFVFQNSLTVCNDSINNKALDHSLLFQRFQFSSDKKRGNGLGLSIVKAICDYHGWRIYYSFEEGKHCFKVAF